MLKFITKSEYVDIMNTDAPKNFDELAIEATAYINKYTHNRIDPSNVSETVKFVTCKLIGLLNTEHSEINGVSNVKSENVDGWSRSYSTAAELRGEYENQKRALLLLYLNGEIGKDGMPLLYAGVDVYDV